MSRKDRRKLKKWEAKIRERLANELELRPSPTMSAINVAYEVSDRVEAVAWGGMAAMHRLARTIGLAEALDKKAHVVKARKPHREPDHILNIAFTAIP